MHDSSIYSTFYLNEYKDWNPIFTHFNHKRTETKGSGRAFAISSLHATPQTCLLLHYNLQYIYTEVKLILAAIWNHHHIWTFWLIVRKVYESHLLMRPLHRGGWEGCLMWGRWTQRWSRWSWQYLKRQLTESSGGNSEAPSSPNPEKKGTKRKKKISQDQDMTGYDRIWQDVTLFYNIPH